MMEAWANAPGLHLELDGPLPPYNDHVWHLYPNGIYVALDEESRLGHFLHYEKPGDGFGGQVFRLEMDDGTEAKLKGPWHCCTAAVNRELPRSQWLMEATVHEPDGGTWGGVAVLIDRAKELLEGTGFQVVSVDGSHFPDSIENPKFPAAQPV